MIYEGFKIRSYERIHDAYCTSYKCRKKRPELIEVSNGFLSTSLFCPECHSVYLLRLVRVPKVNKEFLQQCIDEVELEKRKKILIGEVAHEQEQRKEKERDARLKAKKKRK